ncbi:MAG: 50S ribosomal protein L6 [Bacteroidales bacterium]|jgi:large subunit ribosomal protein L6|nr:50S ribosomal protein L6 [Bacteroidales bacterium]
MSRIGNLPIEIPTGVTVSVSPENVVTVNGPKGEMSQAVVSSIKVAVEESLIVLTRSTEHKEIKSKHGLYRSLISNMIEGVTQGYTKEMELVGVGFRASNQGQVLELSLGFSHNIFLQLAPEIQVETVSERNKNPRIKLTSYDKQLIGQVAAKIRSFRTPEPYKGKGIRFVGEHIRRKAGKSATA